MFLYLCKSRSIRRLKEVGKTSFVNCLFYVRLDFSFCVGKGIESGVQGQTETFAAINEEEGCSGRRA